MRFATLAFASIVVITATSAPLLAKDSKPALPNVVFILADDMGYGDPVSFNADSGCKTPEIDALSAAGKRFTDAHAAGSLCHPSRFGLMTGRYPFFYSNNWRVAPLIHDDMDTVPALLQRAGYQTSMVGKWHLGFEDGPDYDYAKMRGGPVDRGFQSYFGIPASTDIPPYYYIKNDHAILPPTEHIEANNTDGWSPIQGAFWREGLIAKNLSLPEVLDRFGTEASTEVDRLSNSDSPYFLYVALAAPHTPWLPAEEFKGSGRAGMYSEFVAHVDAVVGRINDAIEKSGEADNTMVIFSSDNGPTWYPEDVERFNHASAAHFRGMKADAWEAGHRVPFIVRWPEQIDGGSSSDALVGFVDMLPTFSEMTGEPMQNASQVNGISMASLIGWPDAKPFDRDRPMVQHHSGKAIRQGDWKLIDGLGSFGFTKPSRVKAEPNGPQGQLYHLGRDPGETENLWDKEPQQRERLLKLKRELTTLKQSR